MYCFVLKFGRSDDNYITKIEFTLMKLITRLKRITYMYDKNIQISLKENHRETLIVKNLKRIRSFMCLAFV